jgi:hypothetical protein
MIFRDRPTGKKLAATAAAVLMTAAVLTVGGTTPNLALTDQTVVTLGDFFDVNGPREGAAERLKAALDQAHGCPTFVVFPPIPSDDQRFEVFAVFGDYDLRFSARRHKQVQDLLDALGATDVRSMKHLSRSGEFLEVHYSAAADREKPRLEVLWSPPSATKVKPGDKITAKLTARDDATTAETGVARLRVDVGVGGGLVAAPAVFPAPMPLQECGRENPVRTYEATYTVPADPPPIVNLRAYARDFAGNETWQDANFPTGDWHGTIDKQAKGGGHNHTIKIDFSLDVRADGSVHGRAHAHISTAAGQIPACTMLWTYSPSDFEIPVSARRNGENFEIMLKPGEMTANVMSQCTASQGQNTFAANHNPAGYGVTSFVISARDGATHTAETNAGAAPWGILMRDTIEIHQTRAPGLR